MPGFRSSRFDQRQLGKLSPRAVHFLRQTGYDLISRATHGAPAALRAYAGRLRSTGDELRFRIPAFAAWLGDVAGIADAAALKKETARRLRHPPGSIAGLRFRTNGLAKFSRSRA